MKANIFFLTLTILLVMARCKKEHTVQKDPVDNSKLLLTIPNGDFEDWDPGYWLSVWKNNSCPPCMQPVETYIVKQDSASYSGQFAAKFIFNNAYAAWAENKFAVPYHPAQLTAYVKCNMLAFDSVLIKVSCFHNSQICDSGQWWGTSQFATYTPIVIPVSQNSAVTDTCIIYIRGGQKTNFGPTNTEFWVDNFILQ